MSKNHKPALIYSQGKKVQGSSGSGALNTIMESEPLVDSLACLLLGLSLSMALLSLTELEYTFWGCLGLGILCVLGIAVFRLRWWILPSLAGILLAGNITVRYFSGGLSPWGGYWLGMLGWLAGGARYDPIYSESGGLIVFQLLVILAVMAPLYPLVRRLFLFPLVLALSLGVILYTFILRPGDYSNLICAWAAGIILLIPGFYAGAVAKNSGGKRESRARMQIIAVPAALLAVSMSLAVTPQDTSSWKSRELVTLVEDVFSLFRGPYQTRPAAGANFSLAELGFQAETGRLGGPVKLRNNPALTVTSPVPVLLKGRVLDRYTGSNWEAAYPDGDFRYDSFFWRSYRREAFDQSKPLGGRQARRLYSSLTQEATLTLRYETSRYTSLFTAGKPRSVEISPRLGGTYGYYNMRSELYLHLRMPAREGFSLETSLWDRSGEDFDSRFLQLEALASAAKDEQYVQLYDRYTALPETLPDSVRELTLEITKEADTPYGKVLAINAWLSENCVYTLEPEPLPMDADFVAHFLESKEGYCTYYASALAVMSRCVGIPSRYVMGFALEHKQGDQYAATERTAHAWAEVYFYGIGWMEVDPLSWNSQEPLNMPQEEEPLPEPTAPPAIIPELPEESESQDPPLPEAQIPANAQKNAWLRPLIIVLSIAALYLLARVLIYVAMGGKSRAFNLNRVTRKIPGMPGRLEYYYRDILEQLSLLEITARPGETLVTFPRRVDRRIRFEGIGLSAIAETLMAYHFAGKEPVMEQVRQAWRYHDLLERLLLERLGKTVYLFRRGSLRL